MKISEWDSKYWYLLLTVLLNWKLNGESLKKLSFENWKLGEREKYVILHKQNEMRLLKIDKFFSVVSSKAFYLKEDKCGTFLYVQCF